MLEAEKIRRMLAEAGAGGCAIINTCAVTNEAIKQSRQQFRKILRENPDIPIFVTGCGVTMKPEDFDGATIVPNKDKFNPVAYGIRAMGHEPRVTRFEKMQKKGFVQIGDGCDRHCTYCITRVLRGKAVHFPYGQILVAAKALIDNGYEEIILTGVNIADYNPSLLDLCRKLLDDLPDMKFLTLSSLDPAADVEGIIDLIHKEPRMTKHLHLSVQSGSDTILQKMARRHTAARVREITNYAGGEAAFSWDIICGFPGESEELFNETLELARELRPIKIHAFPFSARPGTPAASMPDKITRKVAKDRVKQICI
jgi:threonylcarbamoyladenosine tRNA methylthiotransferase MtaB